MSMSLNYPTPVFQPTVSPGYPKSTESSNVVTVGYIVGQDNLTGKTIASDGNGTLFKASLSEPPSILNQVTIKRTESTNGSRQMTMGSSKKATQGQQVGGLTSGNVGKAEVDICRFPSLTPPPPEEPDEPEPPPPLPPSDPTNPEEDEEEEELEPGEGCTSESDCQWYNSNESDAVSGSGCPAGTQSRGFAQLSDGSFKVLCCGPDRPAGDGCPDDPTTYGYQCVNGRCELVPNGLYATISECEASGCDQEEPPVAIRYNCSGTECIEAVDGQFASLAECESSGCREQQPIIGPPPFTGGQCDCNRYRVRITVEYLFSDGSGPVTASAEAAVRGPIQGYRVGLRSDFGFTGSGSNRLAYGITARGANWGAGNPPYPSCGDMEERTFFPSSARSPTILSSSMDIMQAPDGDDCGDPPGGGIIGYE